MLAADCLWDLVEADAAISRLRLRSAMAAFSPARWFAFMPALTGVLGNERIGLESGTMLRLTK
jgi:hypothetical protein